MYTIVLLCSFYLLLPGSITQTQHHQAQSFTKTCYDLFMMLGRGKLQQERATSGRTGLRKDGDVPVGGEHDDACKQVLQGSHPKLDRHGNWKGSIDII